VNIPAVSSYHTNFVSYFKYYGFDFASDAGWSYLKWFYNRFQKIYVPSHDTARELTSKGFDNVDLWQRGIELERFSPLYRDEQMRRELAPDGEPILLFVGRLVEEKDLSDLVAANNIMKQNGRKFKLVLVGDGPMRSELESQLPDAHFTGFQKGKDLSRWFATADIFTFPSTTETFGNVVLEAFASGIPAVGVDIGGQTDLIDSGRSGFIARANNPMDFAEKIQILLDNPTMRKEMADYARGYVKKYSWEAINTGLFNGYQSLISNISVN
jgi:glycosyltransferase involved in cell wall biosynthesis